MLSQLFQWQENIQSNCNVVLTDTVNLLHATRQPNSILMEFCIDIDVREKKVRNERSWLMIQSTLV